MAELLRVTWVCVTKDCPQQPTEEMLLHGAPAPYCPKCGEQMEIRDDTDRVDGGDAPPPS